jgi:hypothetical protein
MARDSVSDEKDPLMTLRDLLRSLAHRWYFIIVGFIITAILCVGVVRVVPVAYDSQASMVLLPPQSSTGKHGNPFLLLGGLSQAVDILTRTMNSDADSRPLLDAHHGATFTIEADTTTTGPIVLITSTAPTADRAKTMTSAVVREVPVALKAIQTRLSVEKLSQIRVVTVAVDDSGTLNAKGRTQALVGVGAVGVILTVLITGLIDGLLRARKRRRNTDLDADEQPWDVDDVDHFDSDESARPSARPVADSAASRARRPNPVTVSSHRPEAAGPSASNKKRVARQTASTKDDRRESPGTQDD